MSDKGIAVPLSADEAVVLFEFVSRFTKDEALTIEHGGEKVALWGLCAALEKILVEPFRSDYGDLLLAARDRLATQGGEAGE